MAQLVAFGLSAFLAGAGCAQRTAKPVTVPFVQTVNPTTQPPVPPASSGELEAVRTKSSPPLDALALAARSHPNDAKVLARYGSALVEAGEAPEGIARLRRAVTLDPKLTAAWHNLGLAAERQTWLDLAAESYAHVLAAKPTLTGEWIKLGYVLLPLGRYDEAERAFQRAVALQPNSSEPLVALASTYYARFHYEQAIAALKRAALINPHSVAAQANLASIQQELGKGMEAEAAIRAALAIEPENAQHWLVLGRILHDSSLPQKRAEAQKALTHAISLKAESGQIPLRTGEQSEAYYLLGMMAAGEGKRDRALTWWRQAYQLDPAQTSTQRVLGQELTRRGGSAAVEGRGLLQKYGQAMALRVRDRKMSQEVETRPADEKARLRYGQLLLQEGNLPRAVWELREARRLRPEDGEARRALADALRRQGRDAEAKSAAL